jgi:quinol-cytochrome oxidoreductase complex cytochrome b subunit
MSEEVQFRVCTVELPAYAKNDTICLTKFVIWDVIFSLVSIPTVLLTLLLISKAASRPNKEKKPLGSVYVPHVKGVSKKFKRISKLKPYGPPRFVAGIALPFFFTSIVACVFVCLGNFFTEPLPKNSCGNHLLLSNGSVNTFPRRCNSWINSLLLGKTYNNTW